MCRLGARRIRHHRGRIDRTDAATDIGADGTRTDALARRDALRLEHSVITDAADAAAGKNRGGYGRQLRSELKIPPHRAQVRAHNAHHTTGCGSVTARAGTGYSTEFAVLRGGLANSPSCRFGHVRNNLVPWDEAATAPVASAVQHRSPHRAEPESTVLPADRSGALSRSAAPVSRAPGHRRAGPVRGTGRCRRVSRTSPRVRGRGWSP
ncbi:hypothetical protein CRM89_09670 [Nocardia sp. FDAARGOS_372]|nr:hypothetical protein CRM89_09670 [Nocardia sp. FDAARGOS_372]